MSYTRPQTFVPGAFLRSCDLCGIRYRSFDLVRGEDNFWRCKQYCLEVPALTRDRIAAMSQRRREAPPPKWGVPYGQKDAFAEEAILFNFLVNKPIRGGALYSNGAVFADQRGAAPVSQFIHTANTPFVEPATGSVPFPSSTSSTTPVPSIHETCRYLYYLIVEDKRPEEWIVQSKRKLRELADLLISVQVVSGDQDTNLLYGQYSRAIVQTPGVVPVPSTTILTEQAGCAFAVLCAYRVLGDFKYLRSARAATHVIRHMQWTAFANANYTSSDAAGVNRLDLGAHTQSISTNGSGSWFFDSVFSQTGLIALEFLTELLATDGDSTYGGLGALGTFTFVTTSAAKLSTMISTARQFWRDGTYDNVRGDVRTGLSSVTPAERFNAFPATKPLSGTTGVGAWELSGSTVSTVIAPLDISFGLRSLHKVEGLSTQVTDMWDFLMSITAVQTSLISTLIGLTEYDPAFLNTTLAIVPITPPAGQGNVTTSPLYFPNISMSNNVQVYSNVATQTKLSPMTAASANCSPVINGYMAAIQAERRPSDFKKMKEAFVKIRYSLGPNGGTTFGAESVRIWPLYFCQTTGLSLQANGSLAINTFQLAACGSVFRHGTRGFVSSGRPDNTQPGSAPGTLQEQ